MWHARHSPALQRRLPPVVFAVLLLGELWRPLRPAVESKQRRVGRNLVIAGVSSLVLAFVERPLIDRLSAWVERKRFPLQRARLPRAAELLLGMAWMDYTLYVWHVLTHKQPLLWRLHRVHHSDRDLDVSTALRFHAFEMLLSVPWRAAQVASLGISPRVLHAWQTCLAVSVLFHHSNFRLPRHTEAWLSRLVVTPRLHGIHHSERARDRSANWSSGLVLWDALHGTLVRTLPHDGAPRVGVEGFGRRGVTWRRLLLLRAPEAQRRGRGDGA